MEEKNYLRRGRIYEFVQEFESKEFKIKVYERDEIPSEPLDNVLGKKDGGYITVGNDGIIHAWPSTTLERKMDFLHWKKYKDSKKGKFSNLEFA